MSPGGRPALLDGGSAAPHRSQVELYAARFFRAEGLEDPEGLLEGDGRQMRHVKMSKRDDVREGRFSVWVRQVVAMNLAGGARAR